MRQLTTILLFILLATGCRKLVADAPAPPATTVAMQKPGELIADSFGLSKKQLEVNSLALRKGRGHGKPVDTTTSEPPAQYSGLRVVLIDTNGHYVKNAKWNGGKPFYATAPAMSSSQLMAVVDSAVRAYSHLAYLKLVVTADEAIYNAANPLHRQRVVLTDYSAWYGLAGGVAYRYSFGTETECFVFTGLLGYNVKSIAVAAVHEPGHSLGLPHIAEGYVDMFGVWVTTGLYAKGTADFCPWLGANYNSAAHGFVIGYDRYGWLHDENLIMGTTLKAN
jgi:hypothetical protein